MMKISGLAPAACMAAAILTAAARGSDAPLVLAAKTPLGQVRGRIDHLAIDLARQRLFVAELGNDTVGVVDIAHHAVVRSLNGLHEPQGVGYESITDTLYVANAGDGGVQLFQGADLLPAGRIALGEDADNIRIDPTSHRVIVGYGSGALAIIDPTTRTKIADIRLKAHPESFQIADGRMYINVPDAHEIAVVNHGVQTSTWSPEGLRANFPLALDNTRNQVLVVFRHPATLAVFDVRSGDKLSSIDVCGDSDDVFLDPKRDRIYVSCGEGSVDVLSIRDTRLAKLASIKTVSGARTALFVPEVDRYFLAVRASSSEPAAIWEFRPNE
jgi:DNA-binding beta-propeller fold protein YncE